MYSELKKINLRSIFIITLISSGAAMAASTSNTINVTGTVVDNTCTTDLSTTPTTVPFGRVSSDDLKLANSNITKSFTLNLTGCASGSQGVTVQATGTADSTDSTLFANSTSTGAKGVGVALFGGNSTSSTKLNPAGTNSVSYSTSSGTISMPFTAQLLATGTSSSITAGEYSSTINLMITYQ